MDQSIRKFVTPPVPPPESLSLLTYVVQLMQPPLLANGRAAWSKNSNYCFIKWRGRKQKQKGIGRESGLLQGSFLHLVHLPGFPRSWWRSGEPQQIQLANEVQFCSSPWWSSFRVVHDGLHIVPWKESCYSIHYTLIPPIIIFLYDIDDGTFLKGEFILLVFCVVVDCHN